ncbi:transferase [Segetibacter aerophilus]|uniref:Transferase n=2 Tax=Segetibacter aerophilus TaxID=670293 RepID=A0A512B8V8_9BACT|nr:transferase [Segetibacter aerophilus]
MRPANIVTSIADVLAGVAISGYFLHQTNQLQNLVPVVLLCLSTIGLYGGGVVFNDVFDAELDRVERPERPIPSGLITKKEAATLGIVLLAAGIILAFLVSVIAGLLAFCITVSALVYDKLGKHHRLLGPVNMGLCRGLNLLLGISIIPLALQGHWLLAIIPIIYIASITMISRGEVHGGSKATLYTAALLYAIVLTAILNYSFLKGNLLFTLVFVLPFAWMIFKPLLTAIKEPVGRNIGKAVKAGVLALILMNAAWAAAFGALYLAIVIVILLPLSLKLGRLFAVT